MTRADSQRVRLEQGALCKRCGKALRSESSKARGLGLRCADALGLLRQEKAERRLARERRKVARAQLAALTAEGPLMFPEHDRELIDAARKAAS